MKHKALLRLTVMGLFSALSIVLVYFIHLPIFPAVPFLEYAPADIPIIICSYLFGPLYGLSVTAVVSVIQGLTVSASSGWVGILMHILATGSLVFANSGLRMLLPAKKSSGDIPDSHVSAHVDSTARRVSVDIISALAGILAMTVSMTLWNLIFTPFFTGMKLDAILPLFPFIILFNIIKASLNSFTALALYRLLPKKALAFIS